MAFALLAALLSSVSLIAIASTLRVRTNVAVVLSAVLFFKPFVYGMEQAFGADLPEIALLLAVVMLALLGGAFPIPVRSRRMLGEPGLWAWLLLLGWAAFSIPQSSYPEYGREKLVLLLANGFVPGLAAAYLGVIRPRISWTLVLAIGVVYCILTLGVGGISPGTFHGCE
jgi:hypothetical protein